MIFRPITIFLILLTGLALAEEIPVKIKADTLKFSEQKELVTATGSVEIHIKDLVIRADKLEMYTPQDIVTAEGRVTLKGGGYDAAGKKVTYYSSNETASFYGFKSVQSPGTINGKLYLSGERIFDYKDKMIGENSGITTCDYENPHYLVMAKRVEYYPDDKIIGYNVTFYEGWIGKAPMLWAPYIYYDLKKQRKKNWVIGNNEVEGTFAKTSWDIPLPLAGSVLLLDWMDKKGIGLGTQWEYGNKSSVYLYNIDEKDTKINDWIVKWKHNARINDKTDLQFYHESQKTYLIPSGRSDKFNNRLSWNHRGDHVTQALLEQTDDKQNQNERYNLSLSHSYKGFDTSYGTSLDQKKNEPRQIRWSQYLSHSQPLLFDNTKFKTNFRYNDYIQRTGDIGDERLDIDYAISHSNNWFDLSWYENYYLDLDGSKYPADANLEYMERQPEIIIKGKPLDLKLFSLTPTLGYGWYREVKYVPALGRTRDYSSSRSQASLTAGKTFPSVFGNTFGFNLGIDQFVYEPGDMRYSFTESFALDSGWFDRVRNNASFRRGISEGNSPFFFDTVGVNYNEAKEALSFYYKDKFEWKNSIGYNFRIRKYDDFITSLSLRPSGLLALSLTSGFDLNNKRYRDLSSSIKFSPLRGLTFEVSGTCDINIGVFRSANSLIDWEIGSEAEWRSHMHVTVRSLYDTATQTMKLSDIALVKDLHCWNLSGFYSDYRKEFGFTFAIKAFPSEPFGYAPGRGFYYEGIDKAMQNINESSPRRY
ncbi:hypothetical protein A2276_06545 [candidate division WOR-1 bacterium RIFOXYA12_FULL_43_27]|uniref:Organic solvent tolerance-like N-terminal domain-containing protein n=1 Tax=candidate division WOR-1 bacterium RIFOXYC2_FULL_46_14 TaxID=1802587 RepID=A0A1F4U5H2_UNCSA|nr:MAG: hypothetical protein A2276_06545 [candidate division WOR-1 bacterium RIFOXYA12_FULL_43_27]OGC20305.1 MAG: hypothetical protein A2292_04545 [candidate division WOR-1 bacterium RIFOXYB2_FULL_46_45]OGC31958.1 MAG: hypothetical protein A2232_06905 [candidate division WOR-1 bacterium RIFOXYA2_FULL_46_56]OGC40151.1 MAG: hypothetical protein A2438_02565 [candidate division WOR-1 bacterium RIFOXYC2_FULL_46_14]